MKPETIQLLRNLGLGLGILSLFALLLWGVWHVVRLPIFTIDQVVVSGGETISHDAIGLDVEQALSGEYFNFVPKRFAPTYPKQEILDTLTNTPRVKDPEIERQGRALRVRLAEFEPSALWCSSDAASTTPCVFLDETGYGFAQAPVLFGGAYTRFVRVGEPASVSAVYTDMSDFEQLRSLEQQLSAFGWPVAQIELDTARDVFAQLSQGGHLKVTLELSPAQTLDNLQTVLQAAEYQHLEPGNFAYIDLRFGNKVFVNEFGEPDTEVATSSIESNDQIE